MPMEYVESRRTAGAKIINWRTPREAVVQHHSPRCLRVVAIHRYPSLDMSSAVQCIGLSTEPHHGVGGGDEAAEVQELHGQVVVRRAAAEEGSAAAEGVNSRNLPHGTRRVAPKERHAGRLERGGRWEGVERIRSEDGHSKEKEGRVKHLSWWGVQ